MTPSEQTKAKLSISKLGANTLSKAMEEQTVYDEENHGQGEEDQNEVYRCTSENKVNHTTLSGLETGDTWFVAEE